MTREEKIELLNRLLEIEEKNDIGNLTSTDRREFQQWVEELEQEPILDKIRAEIEARLCDVVSDYTDGYRTAIQGILAIIDEYTSESEE